MDNGGERQERPRRSRLAIASLVLALSPFGALAAAFLFGDGLVRDSLFAVLSLSGLFIFSPLAALLFASMAKRRIARAQGALHGTGYALAGQAIGILWLLFAVGALIVPGLMRHHHFPTEAAAIGNLRTITGAEAAFYQQHGRYGGFAELTSGVPPFLDGTWASVAKPRQGYYFTLHCAEDRFAAHACPKDPSEPGQKWFYTDEGGVIRYSWDGPSDTLCPRLE